MTHPSTQPVPTSSFPPTSSFFAITRAEEVARAYQNKLTAHSFGHGGASSPLSGRPLPPPPAQAVPGGARGFADPSASTVTSPLHLTLPAQGTPCGPGSFAAPLHSISSNHAPSPPTHSTAPTFIGPGGQTLSFAGPYGQILPVPIDPRLAVWFEVVDTDNSRKINAEELGKVLVNGDWSLFEMETVKLIMGICDRDRNGMICFEEFVALWHYVKDWQALFTHFDADKSGYISSTELSNALRSFGYSLSAGILRLLDMKYAIERVDHSHGLVRVISFDRFVRCFVLVKKLTEGFQERDTWKEGKVTLDYDEFLALVLKAV